MTLSPSPSDPLLHFATPPMKENTMSQCQVCGRKLPSPVGRGRPAEVCSKECRTTRKNAQRQAFRHRAKLRGIPEHLHGTMTGATDYGCNCLKCRAWWREYQANRRAKAKEAREVHAAHGVGE